MRVGGWGRGGSASGSSPLALSPSFPMPSLASDPQATSAAWEEEGERRLGQGGGGGEEEEKEGGSWRPRCWLSQLAEDSVLPSACSVGAASSGGPFASPCVDQGTGPAEDDVDLSVLYALGRSGHFSSVVACPPPSFS
jgi:hypothetical protein